MSGLLIAIMSSPVIGGGVNVYISKQVNEMCAKEESKAKVTKLAIAGFLLLAALATPTIVLLMFNCGWFGPGIDPFVILSAVFHAISLYFTGATIVRAISLHMQDKPKQPATPPKDLINFNLLD